MSATGYLDACGFIPASSGAGNFVVSSAITGYQTPASAGAVNSTVYSYRAESADKSQWEEGYGAYTVSTTTLARSTITANSSGGTSAINFSAAPNVFIVGLSADWQNASLLKSGTLPAARLPLTNATLQASPSNPTSTSSGTTVMMGLGKDQAGSGAHPCTLTPVYSGRIRVQFVFEAESGASGNTFSFKLMYGTGTAPSNGAASTGTQVGQTRIPIQNTGNDNATTCLSGIITGLTAGTTYWFDIGAATNGTNSVLLLNVNCEAFEF